VAFKTGTENARIIWSACWYAAVVAHSESGTNATGEAGAAVAASSFELLDRTLA